jgi:hypothetical protein
MAFTVRTPAIRPAAAVDPATSRRRTRPAGDRAGLYREAVARLPGALAKLPAPAGGTGRTGERRRRFQVAAGCVTAAARGGADEPPGAAGETVSPARERIGATPIRLSRIARFNDFMRTHAA